MKSLMLFQNSIMLFQNSIHAVSKQHQKVDDSSKNQEIYRRWTNKLNNKSKR